MMSDNVHSLTLDVLKQLQSGFAEMRDRLDRIEDISRKHRRDSAGTLVMMRATAGDFDARVSEIEERIATLEGDRRI
jgi:glycine cleavage system pyridoxal-binding protein P